MLSFSDILTELLRILLELQWKRQVKTLARIKLPVFVLYCPSKINLALTRVTELFGFLHSIQSQLLRFN